MFAREKEQCTLSVPCAEEPPGGRPKRLPLGLDAVRTSIARSPRISVPGGSSAALKSSSTYTSSSSPEAAAAVSSSAAACSRAAASTRAGSRANGDADDDMASRGPARRRADQELSDARWLGCTVAGLLRRMVSLGGEGNWVSEAVLRLTFHRSFWPRACSAADRGIHGERAATSPISSILYSHSAALRNRCIKEPRRELSRAELRNRAVHCPRARNLALLSPELGLFGLLFGLVRWLRRPT